MRSWFANFNSYFCTAMLSKKSWPSFPAITVFIYMLVLISSCRNETTPDISEIHVDTRLNRFERDLFSLDTNNIRPSLKQLKNKYAEFFDLFAFRITSLGSSDTALMEMHFKSFVNDSNFRAIYNDCEKTFGDFHEQKKEIDEAFRYYKYYFPSKEIPEIVTLISAFSFPIICDSSHLGISLDMYLGPPYRFYSSLDPPLPNYIRSKMSKDYLVCDAMKGWAQSDYTIDESSAKLIEMMISEGRILYFLEKILPYTDDTLKTGYSSNQLKWCRDNESRIWSFFIEQQLLFSGDPNILSKYVNEGPSTNGFPREAPGNIGMYTGWQIVKSYMKTYPEKTLQQLMEEKNLLGIFNDSRYKPPK
jgi:gliding motility-associated lipoprotein GldB